MLAKAQLPAARREEDRRWLVFWGSPGRDGVAQRQNLFAENTLRKAQALRRGSVEKKEGGRIMLRADYKARQGGAKAVTLGFRGSWTQAVQGCKAGGLASCALPRHAGLGLAARCPAVAADTHRYLRQVQQMPGSHS